MLDYSVRNNTNSYNNYYSSRIYKKPRENDYTRSFLNFKSQPDMFKPSSNTDDKKGLSKGLKLTILGLALAGVSALVYYATKGKAGKSQRNAIAEHIDFTPAKSIEEAKIFAKEKLGIYYNIKKEPSLDTINTINEWLSKEKTKTGKIFDIVDFNGVIPDKVNIDNILSCGTISQNNTKYNFLSINVDSINNFDEIVKKVFEPDEISLSNIIRKNNNKYELINNNAKSANMDKFIEKLNNLNLKSSYKDKLELYDGMGAALQVVEQLNKNPNYKINMSDFNWEGAFLHEKGHMLHQEVFKDFEKAPMLSALEENIAMKVSNYAKSDIREFVAEVYKGLRNGRQFSDDIMALYKKYQGPSV